MNRIVKMFSSTNKSNESNIHQFILAKASHLAQPHDKAMVNPYVSKTQKFHQLYSKGKATKFLINLGQFQTAKDPVLCVIWKLVILDQFIDFEKLYTILDHSYDQSNKSKDFSSQFSLVRKYHVTTKCLVYTEPDQTMGVQC